MTYRHGVVSLLVFSLVFVASAQRNANTATSADVFAKLPESQQANIRSALLTMIELEKSGDWAGVYDRFYDNQKARTKEAFVTQRQHSQVLAFVPTNVAFISPAEWAIEGCSKFAPARVGQKDGVLALIYAKLIDGEWKFSVPPVLEMPEGRVKDCDVVSK
jgi:hypothetical protein